MPLCHRFTLCHVNIPAHVYSLNPSLIPTLSHPLPSSNLTPLSQAKERQIEEWSGSESPVSELMRALQDNRRLSTDLADAKAQLSAMDVFNSKNGKTGANTNNDGSDNKHQ